MRYLVLLAATLTLSCAGREIGVESPSKEIIAGLSAAGSSPDGIYVWHGDADLVLRVALTDAISREPISGATVSAFRDRRVAHGPTSRPYPTPDSARTGRGGRAAIRASFPAAGDASGLSVFVGDSYVAVEAAG